MLLLLLALPAVLCPGGGGEEAFQGPTSYHAIQISSFINSSWAQTQGSGWLGDVQIHGWDSAANRAVFLKPWSKGNFSDEEVTELEELIQVYLNGFFLEVQDHASEFQMEYPFEIQGIAGCKLYSGGGTVSFLQGALGGLDFLSLKNYSCVPAPEGGSRAQRICELLSQYKGIQDIGEKLLFETCPRYLLGVLDAGKAELQRQVKPEAWLSAGPSPGPGRLLLVCHVSGFYPKPVWVMWMRENYVQYYHWYLGKECAEPLTQPFGVSCSMKTLCIIINQTNKSFSSRSLKAKPNNTRNHLIKLGTNRLSGAISSDFKA
uniref:MHC class I-like antigen recognition-like domain-containing protein n=1 Tax=Ursus americanus TaxID=9643 RepID=A0A452RHD8_URSAM